MEKFRFIDRVTDPKSGIDHYKVRVPSPDGDLYQVKSYSHSVHTEPGALKAAQEYREKCVKKGLPAGTRIRFETSKELPENSVLAAKGLLKLHEEHPLMRIGTFHLLALYEHNSYTTDEAAKMLNIDERNIYITLKDLHKAGLIKFLRHKTTARTFEIPMTTSKAGKRLVKIYRKSVSSLHLKPPKLNFKDHASTYNECKKYKGCTMSLISLLIIEAGGVSALAVHKNIAPESLKVAQSSMQSIKGLTDKGLLIRSGNRGSYKVKLSAKGRKYLSLIKAI